MIYFRFPFSDQILTTDEISAQKSVGFVSFDTNEIIDFNGNIKEVSLGEFLENTINSDALSSQLIGFKEEKEIDYLSKIQQVINFVKENQLSKLVISRRELLNLEIQKVNLSQTFLNLCKAYPNAFVYFFIKDGKCWMGAFSEVLGKLNKKTSEFETMSLAGTIPVDEVWTSKEIEEQQPVTDYIKNILKEYSTEVTQSETYDHPSGTIKHLRTDFKAKIKREDLEKIISELHPTPAVCGFPKEFCRNAIAEFEDHPRRFYAGYIKVETDETIQYFVNLRCAEFFQNAAVLYVGGGITADSSPEKEWRETELKAGAILKNLSYN
ncbi:chorismate-binding protein [Kaistella sp.]|uniref:chorismate-binding protein n=1 Tax=Kaistella sp. TaxID=2782235 RepID=UPI003C59AF7C